LVETLTSSHLGVGLPIVFGRPGELHGITADQQVSEKLLFGGKLQHKLSKKELACGSSWGWKQYKSEDAGSKTT
jgi:hypothetical protein